MRSFVAWSWLALAVCLTPLVASPVEAQRARSALEQARERMEQGQAYFLQGRFAEAASEFEAAYGIQPFTAFLYNAGIAYENGGELPHAIALFERYVAQESNTRERAEVEARIARLRGQIEAREAQLAREREEREAAAQAAAAAGQAATEAPVEAEVPTAPEAPSTTVVQELLSLVAVETDPAGAAVTITPSGGGTALRGEAPFTQTLPHGSYHLVIEHPDYNRFERDVEVQPGVLNRLFLNLSQGEFLGYLRVASDPPGASVFVDDHDAGPRGTTPWEGPAVVGEHRVWLERPGYEAVERTVQLDAGEEQRVDVALERVSFGRLRVVGNVRGAHVWVDDVEVGVVPWEGQVPAGFRRVSVSSEGLNTWQRGVEVPRGQIVRVRVRLRPAMGRAGAWIAGIASALLLGASVADTLYLQDLYTTLDRERAQGVLLDDDHRAEVGEYLAIGQYVGYGLGGVLAAVTIFYALYDDMPASEATVLDPRDWALLPNLSPNGDYVGLTLSGRF